MMLTREFRLLDYNSAVDIWSRVEGVEIAEGDLPDEVAQFLSRNPNLSRVAIDNGTVVGVALCGHDARRGYIYHVAIEPRYQNRGLARQLTAECLNGLRSLGLKRALILVAADNPGARAFWQRCGWEELSGATVMGIDL